MDARMQIEREARAVNKLAFDPRVKLLWLHLSGRVQYITNGDDCMEADQRVSEITYRAIRNAALRGIIKQYHIARDNDWVGRVPGFVVACAPYSDNSGECIVFRKVWHNTEIHEPRA